MWDTAVITFHHLSIWDLSASKMNMNMYLSKIIILQIHHDAIKIFCTAWSQKM